MFFLKKTFSSLYYEVYARKGIGLEHVHIFRITVVINMGNIDQRGGAY